VAVVVPVLVFILCVLAIVLWYKVYEKYTRERRDTTVVNLGTDSVRFSVVVVDPSATAAGVGNHMYVSAHALKMNEIYAQNSEAPVLSVATPLPPHLSARLPPLQVEAEPEPGIVPEEDQDMTAPQLQ
jgi:hypothetical protein